MPPPLIVKIIELPDRYLVVDLDGNIVGDSIGFVYASGAKEWAEREGLAVSGGEQ